MSKKKKVDPICFCNNVPVEEVKKAITEGAKTLNEIYDKTSAGIGPCGGSCRRKIAPLLERYLSKGKFDDEH